MNVNMLTPDEEKIVKRIVGLTAPVNGDQHGRVWGPVTMEVATGSEPVCRVCRELILRGEPMIRFGFDPTAVIQSGAVVKAAYIHAMPCERWEPGDLGEALQGQARDTREKEEA